MFPFSFVVCHLSEYSDDIASIILSLFFLPPHYPPSLPFSLFTALTFRSNESFFIIILAYMLNLIILLPVFLFPTHIVPFINYLFYINYLFTCIPFVNVFLCSCNSLYFTFYNFFSWLKYIFFQTLLWKTFSYEAAFHFTSVWREGKGNKRTN